jgi:hypothetical protein
MRSWKIILTIAAGMLAVASGGVAQAATGKTGGAGTVVVGKAMKAGMAGMEPCPGKVGFLTQAGGGVLPDLTVVTGGALSGSASVPGKEVPGPVQAGGPLPGMQQPMAIGIAILKVTSVSGSTILGTQIGSDTAITVTVGVSTTYTEAGASATLADVQAGSNIAACGTPGDNNTIQAMSVSILLPQVVGVITAVNNASLTVTGMDGSSHTVTTNSSTKVNRLDATAAVSDLTVGTAVDAVGTYQSDNSLLATVVNIQLPTVFGKVTAVNGNSITIDNGGLNGPAPTIVTSAQTTYNSKGGASSSATSSSVTVGSYIAATGTESANGTTLNALRVVLLPALPPGKVGGVIIGG